LYKINRFTHFLNIFVYSVICVNYLYTVAGDSISHI